MFDGINPRRKEPRAQKRGKQEQDRRHSHPLRLVQRTERFPSVTAEPGDCFLVRIAGHTRKG